MATLDRIQMPALGEEGEACQSCGAPLAADQRYCLNCGERRADPRVDYAQYLQGNGDAPQRRDGKKRDGDRDLTPLYALGGLFALGVVLALGVLIGKGGNGGGNTAAAPQTITVSGAGSGGATAASPTTKKTSGTSSAFTSDWPSGKTGYTVEIGTLAKAGSTPADVDAAKSQATSKGASQVGALDSDRYASLPGGKYVIYSGVYDSKGQATKALKPLKSKFPDATVVKVSHSSGGGSSSGGSGGGGGSLTSGGGGGGGSSKPVPATSQAVQSLQKSSGQAYENQVKHINKPISTGSGKPPPVDNKPAGGGSGSGQVIK
jgi:sporulation related protein